MKIKLKLTRSEYDVLMIAMQQVFMLETRRKTDTQSLLVASLMHALYVRLHGCGPVVREKYRFTIPMPEALAFQLFWTGKKAAGIFDSMLINRIIGEIQNVTTNYLSINRLS